MIKRCLILIPVFILFCLSCEGYQPPSGEDTTELIESNTSCSCEDLTPEWNSALDPNNVYLDLCIESEWNPGTVGASRLNWDDGNVTDAEGFPVQNNEAIGPPEGAGAYESSGTYTCVGIGGSAVWRFDEDYCIYDGPGADFVTFSTVFAWGSACNGLCCELAHVEVSPDLEQWYYNAAEKYDVNPTPAENSSGYKYLNVENIHGNNPTWANTKVCVQAQEIQEVDGVSQWVDIPGVCTSIYFKPGDPYLGGVEFDLSDFKSVTDDSAWPADGQMMYIKIIDDPSILDGQDYSKQWCLGANMSSAMALNCELR